MHYSIVIKTEKCSNALNRLLLILSKKQIPIIGVNQYNINKYDIISFLVYCENSIDHIINNFNKQIDVVKVNYCFLED